MYVGTGSPENTLYAISASTGAVLWKQKASNVVTSPAVENSVVYAGWGNAVHAFSAATGVPLATYHATGSVDVPTVVDGTLYFASGDKHVYAFDVSSPNDPKWSYSTDPYDIDVRTSPTVFNGVVYVGLDNGSIIALDAMNDGQRVWIYPGPQNWMRATAAAANGMIYAGWYDGHVRALRAVNGKVVLGPAGIPIYPLFLARSSKRNGLRRVSL